MAMSYKPTLVIACMTAWNLFCILVFFLFTSSKCFLCWCPFIDKELLFPSQMASTGFLFVCLLIYLNLYPPFLSLGKEGIMV